MKKHLLTLCSILLLMTACKSVPETKNLQTGKLQTGSLPFIELTKSSAVRIVIPAEHANPGIETFLQQCANVIRRGLKETLGIDAPVEVEGKRNAFEGHTFFLGNTQAIRSIGFEPATFENFDAVIATRGNDIFIAGNDRHRFGKPEAVRGSNQCVLGTVTGTVRFVEKYLNGRFLLPGSVGLDFEECAKLSVPANFTWRISPRIIMGGGRYNELFYDYSNSNPGYGGIHLYGGHSYYTAVPAKEYAQSHPEYFAWRDGKRSSLGNHLCISNPDVQELIYKEMLSKLDGGAEAVELAQTDGFTPCLCDQCKAYGNTDDYGEKLWILHRSMAERLLKERPGKKVVIICYPPNSEPPKSFSEFPANTMIELCRYSDEFFNEWKKVKVPGGFLTYIYNWGDYQVTGYTPKLPPSYIAAQARTFAANGVKGVYRCGCGELCGLEGPVYYLYGKMLEDPSLNVEALLKEYYARAYYESAAPMRTFFDTLHRALEFMSWNKENRYFSNQRNVFSALYPPDVMETLEKNLARAEKQATQEKVKARLLLVRKEFDYLKSIVDVVRLYQAYRTAPSWETFDLLAQKIDTRNALIASMLGKNGRAARLSEFPEVRFFDGASKAYLADNGRSATLGAPFNWNTAFLKEKGILPGTTAKKLTVKRIKGDAVFNDFATGVWEALPWEELGGIQLGPIVEKTRFKAAYDDKNFYLAFVSDLDPKKTFNSLGKDGPCWRNDCIEILLDPAGDRQSFYHVIYTPAEESRYDEAFGFITDPLHPLYNKNDPSWDGDWSYSCRREGGKWYSLFTVPFEALKTQVPKPGNTWTLNVGRESRIIGGSGNEVPELSLWSPNLENAGFHDRETFGEAVFE
ncbi:MAG: DUF4838 domain-containing protein [Victivallales bacterium]|nr:DUF4838 domain-containing protein [Victivallales bacterium]